MNQRCTALLLCLLLFPVLSHARAEGHFDRTLSVSGAVNLDLTTGSGDVVIKAGGGNQMVIHGRVQSSDWFSDGERAVRQVESNPPIQQSGNSIRIGYNLPDDIKRHIAISYELTVPADTVVQVAYWLGRYRSRGCSLRGSRLPPAPATSACATSAPGSGSRPAAAESVPWMWPHRSMLTQAAVISMPS